MVINTDKKITERIAHERYSKGRKPVIHLTGEKVDNKRTVRKKIDNKYVRINEELTLRIEGSNSIRIFPCMLKGSGVILLSIHDMDTRTINWIRSTIDDEDSRRVLHISEI